MCVVEGNGGGYGVRDDLYDKNDIGRLRVDIELLETLHVDGNERDTALLALCATHANATSRGGCSFTLPSFFSPSWQQPPGGGGHGARGPATMRDATSLASSPPYSTVYIVVCTRTQNYQQSWCQ